MYLSCLSIHLPTYLAISPCTCLSIDLFVYLLVHSFIYQSECPCNHQFICLSVHLFICLPVHPSICVCVHLSIHLSVCPSTHWFIFLTVHPSIYLCLSIYPSVCPASTYLPVHCRSYSCPKCCFLFYDDVSLCLQFLKHSRILQQDRSGERLAPPKSSNNCQPHVTVLCVTRTFPSISCANKEFRFTEWLM
jgi:hypothetical protein